VEFEGRCFLDGGMFRRRREGDSNVVGGSTLDSFVDSEAELEG
jgi:hypothetical protein